ncbi:MAG: L-aspartate oxidase [Rhodospirillales bacterium]|nr:L-aspartate oxidase [Rhodospirillales bacterium]
MIPKMQKRDDAVIVVGSGMAGLVCALSLAPRPVTLITKTPELAGGSSLWAQGGIAAAIGPKDSPKMHAADTLSAGAGLSDPECVRQLTEESVEALHWLTKQGVAFDRTINGTLALAQEAAHCTPRVVHAGGDATGLVLMGSLIKRVADTPSITVLSNTFAHDLVVHDGHVQGLVTYNPTNGWVTHQTACVVLATGGIGTIWWHTTNPIEATGDGLAIAARAGAALSDLEFVQFHPTALAIKKSNGDSTSGASLPLLTEALRGAGARLIDDAGDRIMLDEHPLGEMAPRDVIARAIHKQTHKGQSVYLDLRPVLAGGLGPSFPQAMEIAQKAGFNPHIEPLPVTPAAHYHMGGIQTDSRGRTSIDGLWAGGEVATTGIHGANRLASNSLLEALAYARRVATDIRTAPAQEPQKMPLPTIPDMPTQSDVAQLRAIEDATRRLMSEHVGILRTGPALDTAHDQLIALETQLTDLNTHTSASGGLVRTWGETRNRLLIARLITLAASLREESRGAHHRDDFPIPLLNWQRHQTMTVEALQNTHQKIA